LIDRLRRFARKTVPDDNGDYTKYGASSAPRSEKQDQDAAQAFWNMIPYWKTGKSPGM
jgi:hypothetical protein